MTHKVKIHVFLILSLVMTSCANRAEKELVTAKERITILEDSLKLVSSYKNHLIRTTSRLQDRLDKLEPKGGTSNESFEYFLIKFSEQKEFQKSRILFPIKVDEYILGKPHSLDTLNIDEWDTNKYKFHPEGFGVYDNKQMVLRNTNFRMVRWFAYEACGDLRFHFKSIKGKWFLYYVYHDG